ncbi:THO complex subunit 2 [Biomphalaria glabrata]|nr:THO complex subunit 2 [Biomphalaria glabrata]
MERLEEEKHSWFPTGTLKSEMTTNLLQYCLFPRCCFTASDAIYCGHFIQVLHNLKTPNFSTLITYDRECFNFPGFLTVFRKGTDMNNKMNRLDYENYRHVCHKWHFRLTKILPHFPRMTQIGMAIERQVDKLSKEKDKRPDIYALVIGYAGQLKSKKPT